MSDVTRTADREAISKRAMEILNQRYQECDASPNKHISPVLETCVHCYRHISYKSDKDPKIEGDLSVGLMAILNRIYDGRLH